MSSAFAPDIQANRLSAGDYARNFADASPPLSVSQALLEAERCLYCFDAPCATACPTGIDVPSFIKRIADGNLRGSARTILEANPLGGMCARVCPTENLCEKVCVRNTQEGRPVQIGRLQRHAVDALMESAQPQLFTRAAPTGKTVAVVGAGPAGLACAHTLARLGHAVVVYDAKPKAGGLNEYGLASYKTPDDFAQKEIAWLLDIGGITLRQGWRLETPAQLDALRQDHDALFLGMGLQQTHLLGVPGEHLDGVQDAVDFIATLRQTPQLATLPIGRRVVVIGGGMTAVDAAVQSKLLGAQEVHMVYRRGANTMSASNAEQDWAQTHGVTLHHWRQRKLWALTARPAACALPTRPWWTASCRPPARPTPWRPTRYSRPSAKGWVTRCWRKPAWRCRMGALPPTPWARPTCPGFGPVATAVPVGST